TVDRVILRIAVYEMKYEEEIPTSVTLNEAIELAKTFGDDQSSKFINGVLSKVLTTLSK
ncbi:MAG: transcription antitermination factor NusB, partial [Priestia megaterium]